MKPSADICRKVCSFSVFLFICALVLVWFSAPRAGSALIVSEQAEIPDYDIRADQSEAARGAVERFVSAAGQTRAGLAAAHKESLRAESDLERGGSVRLNIERRELTQAPEIIAPDLAAGDTRLTAPSGAKRVDILRQYLKQNSALVGLTDSRIDALETAADYTNPDGVLSFVVLAQRINGVPVFGGEVSAGMTGRGEIFRLVNNLAPGLDDAGLSTDFGSAEEAAARAAKYIDGAPLFEPTKTEKIYFPVAAGVARPAWRVLLQTATDAFYVITDARDGTLLWRKNLTARQTQPATFEVYGSSTSMTKTGDSPSAFTPGCTTPTGCAQPPAVARQSFTLIGNEPPYAFNNNGWIPDGENRTIGNNAEAGINRDGMPGIDPNGWAFGNPNRNFVYVYNPAPGIPPPGEEPVPTTQVYPPTPFQQGSIANAFYAANRWHDETYRLGFTEQARNFQLDNFGRGGQGNDALIVQVQDSSGTTGATFSTAADGNRGRLILMIWTPATPDRDGALDNQIIMHELTHGLSSRLVGNGTGLGSRMATGMGEGWSDFFAFALLSEPTDNPLGTHALSGYVSYQLGGSTSNYYYGLRRFPLAVKASVGPNGLPHNPLTFKYLNSNCDTFIGTTLTNPNSAYPRNPVISTSSGVQACDQAHNSGEIWSAALWEVRNQLIERHGAFEGNRRALQYVMDGMKLSPLNPTFLQERDAIIGAAAASDADDVLPVRRGFAIRGMGFYASIQNPGSGSNTTVVTESFDVTANVFISPDITVSDANGNGNGYPEPGETISIAVPLTNNTGMTINDVSVQIAGGGSASYGNIPDGATVVRQMTFTVPASTACGTYLPINFNIGSSAGTRTETRSILIGVPVGGPPSVFTNSTPLTIPASGASTPYGTTINASGLSGNKKIKLELTGFSHTFPSDVDVLLVGPGGQKFIVMSDAVNSAAAQTNANVVFRDDAALLLPASGQINMNGEWKPTDYNSGDTFPAPAPAAPYSSPAPNGSSSFASVFGTAGASLNGTWTLYLVDDANSDGGSLAGWKLTFEPNDYLCCSCPLRQKPVASTPDADSAVPTCSCIAPPARADFDGDGKSDLAVFRPAEGNWYLNQTSLGFGAVNWGLSSDQLAPGDYDGDLKTDFAVFRPNADSSQPDFYVLRSGNFTYGAYSWGLPGDVPVIEDYDGDTRRDIAVYRPSNHTFYVYRSFDGNVMTYSGITAGVPAAGDFDGDGKGDFASYDTDGWYHSWSSANFSSVNFTQWGLAGDIPVPADYDADGKDDFAVFRPSNGVWYIRQSTGVNAFVQFGLAGDVPVPGDYDGDRKSDIGVYRSGVWYLYRSGTGIAITQFGLSVDVPVANRYLP